MTTGTSHSIERMTRAVVIVLFVVSGTSHCENPLRFVDTIYSYKLVSPWCGGFAAMVIPLLQLQIALSFFADVYRRVAWMWSALIFGLFGLVQGILVSRGLNVQCGCFGDVVHLDVGMKSVVMASVLMAMSLYCCRISAREGPGEVAADESGIATDGT